MVAACDDCVERRTCTEGDGEEGEENDIQSHSSELMSHCDSSKQCRRDIYGGFSRSVSMKFGVPKGGLVWST